MSIDEQNYQAPLCGKIIGKRGRPLAPVVKDGGYVSVSLSDGVGKPNQTLVHRFVWEYFKGPIPKGSTVDHIDEDKNNNKINNLQLLTRGENSRKGNRILSDEEILALNSFLGVIEGKEIAKIFGVSPQTVSNIKSGFRWNHVTNNKEIH